jgi:hypothetical protein
MNWKWFTCKIFTQDKGHLKHKDELTTAQTSRYYKTGKCKAPNFNFKLLKSLPQDVIMDKSQHYKTLTSHGLKCWPCLRTYIHTYIGRSFSGKTLTVDGSLVK